MILINNTTQLVQMKSCSLILLVDMIRICAGLHLFYCPGPTNGNDEALLPTSFPFLPKLTLRGGVLLCGLRHFLVKNSYHLALQHLVVEVETSGFNLSSACTVPSTSGVREESACHSERL